jgi:hypothetical protein
MIGMPTYGRSFTLVDPTKFDIGAPASGGGAPGKYTGEAGFMSYYEVIYVTYTRPFPFSSYIAMKCLQCFLPGHSYI